MSTPALRTIPLKSTRAQTYPIISVALVDNDERVLHSLSAMLTSCSTNSFSILWTCTNGSDALNRCADRHNRPDLLFLDMYLEGLQGADICRQLRMDNSVTPVCAMTCYSLNRYMASAIQAGAQALVDKNDDNALIQAANTLVHGFAYPDFETPKTAFVRLRRECDSKPQLSPREQEIMELCARDGLLDDEIADKLHISQGTVRKHLQHIMAKLGVKSSRQAVSQWLTQDHHHE